MNFFRYFSSRILVVTITLVSGLFGIAGDAESMPIAFEKDVFQNRSSHILLAGTIGNELDDQQKKAIQRALKILGHYGGKIDGSFGPSTRASIEKFQTTAGLAVTGELTSAQSDYLINREKEEEEKKLAALSQGSPTTSTKKITTEKNISGNTEASLSQPEEEIPSTKVGGADSINNSSAELVKQALARKFSGPFGGQWHGTLRCEIAGNQYEKEIALRIDGKEAFVDNAGDFKSGNEFTNAGSIKTDDGWLSDPGDMSIQGGGLYFKGNHYTWGILQNWPKSNLSVEVEVSPQDSDPQDPVIFPCTAKLSEGVSEKIEVARAEYSKFVDSGEGAENFLTKMFSSSGSGGGAVFKGLDLGDLGTSFFNDPIFKGRSTIETYIATTRLLHLATRSAGKGIADASLALGLKEKKDIPQYLLDTQISQESASLAIDVVEQDIAIIEFSTDSAKEIKERLASGDFELSDETRAQLAKAHEQLSKASIYQGKTTIGIGIIALKISNTNAQTELQGFVENKEAATEELPKILSNMKDFIWNFGDIVEVAEVIEETKDKTGVNLLKEEFIQASANEQIDEEVLDDLELAAD